MRELEQIRARNYVGFMLINMNLAEYDQLTAQVYRRIVYFQNNKLVLGHDDKKISGLYLFSSGTSIGKSAFLNCIRQIVFSYKHCLTDQGQQEDVDMDAKENETYKAYLIDGLNDSKNFNFSILESITDEDVSLSRRATVPGKLSKGTPFIITSNLSPYELLGELPARILTARCLIVNCEGVQLYMLLQVIRTIHGLDPYVQSSLNIPEDLL